MAAYSCEEFACFDPKVSVTLLVRISYFHSELVKCAERLEVSCCYVCWVWGEMSGLQALIKRWAAAHPRSDAGLLGARAWTDNALCPERPVLLDQAPVSLVDCKARAQPLEPG